MITKKKYEALKAMQVEASANNDYSKMIIVGDKNDLLMKEYFREKICTHPNVEGRMPERCTTCGKEWE